MRFFGIFVSVLFLLAAASAADLRIKVVDPQSAAVAGAQVELFRGESSTPAAIQTTSADGLAVFRGTDAASYRARILAAGFAEQTIGHFRVQLGSNYREPPAGSGHRNR